MKKKLSVLFITLFVACLLNAGNPYINFQGKLTNDAGQPITDNSVAMVFKLCTDPAGTAAGWTETQTVNVQNGLYSVNLGTVTAISGINFNQNLWLEVKVNGNILLPRYSLTTVPHAFVADNLGTLTSDLDISGNMIVNVATQPVNDGDVASRKFVLDRISVGGDGLGNHTVEQDLINDVDNQNDLGVSTRSWRNLYVDGTGYINTLSITTDLSVAQGGTGVSSLTNNGVLYGDNTNAVDVTAAGTQYQVLQADGAGVPFFGGLDDNNLSSGDYDSLTGVGTQGEDLDMGTNLVVNIATQPVNDGDVASRKFVLDRIAIGGDGLGSHVAEQDLINDVDNQNDLGVSTRSWRNLYVDGTGYINTLSITTDLSVAQGGTGVSSLTNNGVLYGDNANAVDVTAAGTQYQVLQADGSGVPFFGGIDNNNLGSGDYNSITGIGTQSQVLDMNENKIVNVSTPTADLDAATKLYVDDSIAASPDNDNVAGNVDGNEVDSNTLGSYHIVPATITTLEILDGTITDIDVILTTAAITVGTWQDEMIEDGITVSPNFIATGEINPDVIVSSIAVNVVKERQISADSVGPSAIIEDSTYDILVSSSAFADTLDGINSTGFQLSLGDTTSWTAANSSQLGSLDATSWTTDAELLSSTNTLLSKSSATLFYVTKSSATSNYLNLGGGTMSGNLLMGNNDLDGINTLAFTVNIDTTTAPSKAGILGTNSNWELYISTGTGSGAWVKIGGQ